MRKVLYVLGQMDDLDVQWLARVGGRRRVAAGQPIIRQGEASPSLFILLDGELSVDIVGRGRVALLRQGEVIGEMSFVDSAPPSATVSGVGEAVVLDIPKHDLEAKIAADAGFGLRFYRAIALFLADRLRIAQGGKAAGAPSLSDAARQADELDEKLLDSVSLAGDRFDRLLRTLAGASG
ncbi:MAG: cyclic nucleotide-binding domain-containing protein [Acetobacteraceae bacterium]